MYVYWSLKNPTTSQLWTYSFIDLESGVGDLTPDTAPTVLCTGISLNDHGRPGGEDERPIGFTSAVDMV